jgi:hypothetical protein
MFKVGNKVETIGPHPMSGTILELKQVGALLQVTVNTKYGPWLFKDSELRKKSSSVEERQEFSASVLPDKAPPTISEIDSLLNSVDVKMWASKLGLGDVTTDKEFSHYNAGQKTMYARRKIRQLFETNPEICRNEHSKILNRNSKT